MHKTPPKAHPSRHPSREKSNRAHKSERRAHFSNRNGKPSAEAKAAADYYVGHTYGSARPGPIPLKSSPPHRAHQVMPEVRETMAPHVVTLLHHAIPFQFAKSKLAEQLVMWARAHSETDERACTALGIGLRSVVAHSRVRQSRSKCDAPLTEMPAPAQSAVVTLADALMVRRFNYERSLLLFEREMVRLAVERAHGNRSRAARALGLHVNTVRNVLRAERNGR